MKHIFQPSLALASLTCALLGASLAGCNRGGDSGGIAGVSGGSSSDTLATVGASKVTRADLTTFLEAQGGQQALPILIDTQLIFEALKAKGLDVSDAEVEADLTRRSASDPQVAALVTAGGLRLPIIKTQIKRELAVQKLLTAGITASDAQVKSFYEKNRVYYDTPSKVTVGVLLSSTKTRADLMAAQLQKKSKTFAQLVAEQKKAVDPVAANSTEGEQLSRFPPVIAEKVKPAIAKLSKGGVSAVQNFGGQAFAIFMVVDKTAPVPADFAKIKADVELDYKAAEVAKKVVADNKNNPPFDETIKRTLTSLQGQNPTATLRDTLNYINQIKATALISALRTAGTVQIDDAAYAKVATPYQAVTGAAGGAPDAAPSNATPSNAAPSNAATGNAATGNAATGNAATGNAATGNAATGTTPAQP